LQGYKKFLKVSVCNAMRVQKFFMTKQIEAKDRVSQGVCYIMYGRSGFLLIGQWDISNKGA
jgi:hypothetical protein